MGRRGKRKCIGMPRKGTWSKQNAKRRHNAEYKKSIRMKEEKFEDSLRELRFTSTMSSPDPGSDEGRQVSDQNFHSLDQVSEECKMAWPSITSGMLQDSGTTIGLKQELTLPDECSPLVGAQLQENKQSGSNGDHGAYKETLTMTLDREVFNSWCSIGSNFCLDSNSQIAEFLVHCYQNKASLEPCKSCGTCGAVLSLQCVHCSAKQPKENTELSHKPPKVQQNQAKLKSVTKVKPTPWIKRKFYGRLTQHHEPCESVKDVQTLASVIIPEDPEISEDSLPLLKIQTLNNGDDGDNDDDDAADPGGDLISENIINEKKPNTFRGDSEKKLDSLRRQISEVEEEDSDGLLCGDESKDDSHTDDTSGVTKKKTGQPSLKSSNGKYDCNDCGKSYSTSKGLKQHRKQHSGDLPCCHICRKTFTTLRTLKVHQNIIHAGLKPFMCDVCNRSFGQRSNLRMHKLTHSDGKPHLCGLCEKTFKSLRQLKAHAGVHSGSRDHVCEVCGKRFNQLCNLRRHKLIHSGLKRFVCDICNRAFTRAESLKKHKVNHLPQPGQPKVDIKSYVKRVICDTCGKSFASNYMKLHKMTHTGEKPHVCEVCNKGFIQYGVFKAHKLMHSGQKPYRCKVCNRAYSVSSSLNAHKIIHENKKIIFECEVCSKVIKYYCNFRRHLRIHDNKRKSGTKR